MKITVCQLGNSSEKLEQDWQALVEHVQAQQSDLVLLPEMPFHPWLAESRDVDPTCWQDAVEAHERWLPRLVELAPATVAGTRPVTEEGARLNEGFIWEPGSGYRPVHTKYYLPNEDGFWEATWYQRGEREFSVVDSNLGRIGFLICTEMWFNAHARDYAREGIHLLLSPRATPASTVDKWVAGGRTAAVVAGAFCLSSNRGGPGWGGTGWIIEPDEGQVLGLTSQDEPFLTREVDLSLADAAKSTYPRYVLD